jgi:hypothetical protein
MMSCWFLLLLKCFILLCCLPVPMHCNQVLVIILLRHGGGLIWLIYGSTSAGELSFTAINSSVCVSVPTNCLTSGQG